MGKNALFLRLDELQAIFLIDTIVSK